MSGVRYIRREPRGIVIARAVGTVCGLAVYHARRVELAVRRCIALAPMGVVFMLAVAFTPSNAIAKIWQPLRRRFDYTAFNRGERRAGGNHDPVMRLVRRA